MRLIAWLLFVFTLLPQARADKQSELAHMLSKYPQADANQDGSLTEEEAGNYVLRNLQRKRPNRGSGIRNRGLIDAYEPHTYKKLPYRLLKPTTIKPGQQYPLVVSLHGSGGIGNDNVSNLRSWNAVMARPAWREKYPSFVLVPQRKPGGTWGPKPNSARAKDFYVRNDLLPLLELIAKIRQEQPIDDARIYALGSSGGGIGTWNILLAKPDLFAAAIPVCGRFPAKPEDYAKLTPVPIWCFHGSVDQLIDVEQSRHAFSKLTKAGGLIKYTELRGVKHNSWIQAFSYQKDDASKGYITKRSNDRCDPTSNSWDWLFRQKKTR